MPKVRIPYRVRRPFQIYRKGQIIYPTGLRKDELLAMCFIERVPEEPPAPEPEPEPQPDPVDDIEPEQPEADPLVESAVLPEAETATAPEPDKPRRKRRRPQKGNDHA